MDTIFKQLKFIDGTDFRNSVTIIGHIGAGNSSVYEVTLEKGQKNKTMAMKVYFQIFHSSFQESIAKNQQQSQCILKEITLFQKLNSLNHDFIIKYHSHMICEHQAHNEYQENFRVVFILMEKGKSSLCRFIESLNGYLSFDIIQKIIMTSINGFAFLQQNNIAHQDIKPENILVMDSEELLLKICDVGSGMDMSEEDNTSIQIVGTIPFMAPELMQLKTNRENSNPFKCDVFSLGLCFVYIITFQKLSSQKRREVGVSLYKEIIRDYLRQAKQIVGSNKTIMKILSLMLEFDNQLRPDFLQLQEHISRINTVTKMASSAPNVNVEKEEPQAIFQLRPQSRSIKVNQIESQTQRKQLMSSFVNTTKKQIIIRKVKSFKERTESIEQKAPIQALRRTENNFQIKKKQMSYQNLDVQFQPPKQISNTFGLVNKNIDDRIIYIPNDGENLNSIPQHNLISTRFGDSHHSFVCISSEQYQDVSLTEHQFKYLCILLKKLSITYGPGILVNSLTLQIDEESFDEYMKLSTHFQSFGLKYLEIRFIGQFDDQIVERIQQCSGLKSLSLSFTQAISEMAHKALLQFISKYECLETLYLNFSRSNICLKQPQWHFNTVLRKLYLNYEGCQIERSINSLSLSFGNLSNLESLYLNIGQCQCNLKEFSFLMVQISKLKNLNELVLMMDNMVCINQQFMINNLLKLNQLTYIYISIIGANDVVVEQILQLFETMQRFQNKTTGQFSLRMDRAYSKNQIIQMSIKNKVLTNFKIDFLTNQFNSLRVVYLKNRELIKPQQQYPQKCNGGLNIRTSQMSICLTCSHQFHLNRPVYVCEQCMIFCHIHEFVPQSLQKGTVRHLDQQQAHNCVKAWDFNQYQCDCHLLGQCKLQGQPTCHIGENKKIYQNSYKQLFQDFNSIRCTTCKLDSFICSVCRQACHKDHQIEQFYIQLFQCSCENNSLQLPLQL